MNKWIDANNEMNVGDVGYLVSLDNSNTRAWDVLRLYPTPLRTNRSHEERLTGWCGETNNVSRTAMGAWRIVKTNKRGDRMLIQQLKGADLCAFLMNDGRPELIPGGFTEVWRRGSNAGEEDVENVLAEQGREVVIATLAPGHLAWDEGAINAHAHKTDEVPENLKNIYYRAYAIAARARAEEIRDSRT